MDNKEFGKILEMRTKKFAVDIIKLSASLPSTAEGFVIRKQLTKSGTSIGANYREANRSRSKADLISKIKICESEASETAYWLEIILDIEWAVPSDLTVMLSETNEFLAIFTSTGKTLKL